MMKRKGIILTAVLVLLQLSVSLWALPTTANEAEMVVAGWLKANPEPLGTVLCPEITRVETFTDDYGEPLYYIVYLKPSGFVIVSADDLVEPIIGFADEGTYDPSVENPLGALVTNDLNGRMATVRRTFNLLSIVGEAPLSDTQKKWTLFLSLGESSEGGFSLMGRNSIPDVRVAPLVQSEWSQRRTCSRDCYNYYTPNNYPCGCTATAMAQLMRYHRYPTAGIGRVQFGINVDDKSEHVYTRGGNGNGGPYKWDQMVLVPNCSTTLEQRQAIGALCYDASVAAETHYSSDGSTSNMYKAKEALRNTFKYRNAVRGYDYDYSMGTFNNIDSGLEGMVNANLDAGNPVILGISKEGADTGHAILADGYGYDFSTLYHHLNMGWAGGYDAWYSLPIVNSNPSYNVVEECIYNIFTTGSGEIISGRVTDASGNPISGATVVGRYSDSTYSDETDSRGIYALAKLRSRRTYTVRVTKSGYNFTSREVRTGASEDGEPASGNKWGIDFVAAGSSPHTGSAVEDFETGDFSKFPWEHEGDSDWRVTSRESSSGTCSAESGTIEDHGVTTLQVRVDCVSGNISFYRKVSSESLSDYLKFYIDGEETGEWSGEEDWAEVSFPVRAGIRTFEWTYSKDYSVSEGDDTVWIDDIVFPVPVEEPPLPPPPGPTPTSKLVGWWKLEEGSGVIAADSSGNGHDGTTQATPEWVDGPSGYGKALYFDGSDPAPAWVNCGTWNPSAGTGQLTVALWVRWDGAIPGVWQGVIAKRDSGGNEGARMMWDILINRDNHKITFSRVGSYPSCGGRVLPRGQWSHVAATFDGTTMIFYIDGEETGRGNFSFGTKTNSTIIIGALNKGGGGGFHGALDDIRLYNNALSPAEIESLAAPQSVTPPASEWSNQDIGWPTAAGSANYDSATETWTIEGDGYDIWNDSDAFHYVYKPLSGDGEIITRVVSVEFTDPWAKAGVMIREGLGTDSKHAHLIIAPGNGCRFQLRRQTASNSESDTPVTNLQHIRPPHWVKLTRRGNQFRAYHSKNGQKWDELLWSPQTIVMRNNVYIGMVVTSHADGVLCTAVFDNVQKKANNPTPPDGGAIYDENRVNLTWSPGDGAVSHDVYFGDNFESVNNGESGTFRGNLTTMVFPVGFPRGLYPNGLVFGTTYYWRIDEVQADGTTVYKGDVWSFTIGHTSGGLRGEYYQWSGPAPPSQTAAFSRLMTTRIDPQINFNWGTGSPKAGVVSGDNFAVRWTGFVTADFTGTYTFYTTTDDGVRLWVNDQLIINQWREQGATEWKGMISLVAGKRSNIRMEMYENKVDAVAQLRWSSRHMPKQIIPESALSPP